VCKSANSPIGLQSSPPILLVTTADPAAILIRLYLTQPSNSLNTLFRTPVPRF